MAADKYTVERTTTVEAPAGRIYDHIVDFRKWPAWSPWEDLDPTMQRGYAGSEAGPGAVYTWTGNKKVGEGRMEIVDVVDSERVDIDLQFVKPFKSRNDTSFVLTPRGEQSTDVLWTMTGKKTFMTKVMGLFTSMDKMVGPDFEKGLGRLKSLAERGSQTP